MKEKARFCAILFVKTSFFHAFLQKTKKLKKNLKNLPKTLDKICEFMVKYTGCHELRQRKHIDKRIVKAKQQKRILHN